jgi:hypothetical protein
MKGITFSQGKPWKAEPKPPLGRPQGSGHLALLSRRSLGVGTIKMLLFPIFKFAESSTHHNSAKRTEGSSLEWVLEVHSFFFARFVGESKIKNEEFYAAFTPNKMVFNHGRRGCLHRLAYRLSGYSWK